MAVLSIVEATVMQLKNDLPHIKKLNFQSDNTKCYQSGYLLFGLYLIFQMHGLILKSYSHSETQDGKSSIDAHFAICMRFLLLFVNMGMNIISPLELYRALCTNGGVINSVPTLFELDRTCVEELVLKHEKAFSFF